MKKKSPQTSHTAKLYLLTQLENVEKVLTKLLHITELLIKYQKIGSLASRLKLSGFPQTVFLHESEEVGLA